MNSETNGVGMQGTSLDSISQPVLTLGEASIHAARHSHSLILKRWINGSLPVFGYFHAHYLFSSALILAMSSFVPIGNPSDIGSFEAALEILQSMSENGNLAASEFFQNLQQVKFCLDSYRERSGRPAENAAAAIGPGNIPTSSTLAPPILPAESEINPTTNPPVSLGMQDTAQGFTTAMAFLEPTMQDFLAQSDFDLGLMHPVDIFMNESESLYTGHEL